MARRGVTPFAEHEIMSLGKNSYTETGFVAIKVYNTVGQEVRKLLETRLSTGTHSITWDGKENDGKLVGTGVYIYVLQHNANNQTLSLARKLLMLR
jgi:flagellar hook assembly protein FlgD